MDFSLGLSKLHEHPLADEDTLLDDCTKRGLFAGKELFARSNQLGFIVLTPVIVMSN